MDARHEQLPCSRLIAVRSSPVKMGEDVYDCNRIIALKSFTRRYLKPLHLREGKLV